MADLQTVLSPITWPTAFAIVASVATFVTGFFGYMIKTKTLKQQPQEGRAISDPVIRTEVQQVHLRVSDLKDRISQIESDTRVFVATNHGLEQRLNSQEGREKNTVQQLNAKIDKLTDIVLKILSDEHL